MAEPPFTDHEIFIKKLTGIVLSNLQNENFGVDDLAGEAGLSRSALHRRIWAIKKSNISHFIREVRLNRAMELLRHHTGHASEIAYQVGFGSPSYFNKCFHEYYGYPPGEEKRRIFSEGSPTTGRSPAPPETILKAGVRKSHNMVFLVSAAALVLLALSWILYNHLIKGTGISGIYDSGEKDLSIIVLPFKNISDDPGNQYFADGIGEDILNHLFNIPELRVASRTSAEQFRESTLSTPEIARKMQVNYVLEGSVRWQHERVRVSVKLIDGRRDRNLWSENYDRQMTDVFAIQSDIAINVARELQFVLTRAEIDQIEKIPTKNPEAYNYYLMGRFFWNKWTENGLKRSMEYFEKAIASDPDYALAYAGLADAYFIQTWWMWGQRPAGYEKAKQLALMALELDKNLVEAYATLGGILCYYNWNWEESRKMLIKAIQINPSYATAHQYYSELLNVLGENDLARVHIDIAIQLDPVAFMHHAVGAGNFYREGRYDEALEAFRKLEEINPDHGTTKHYYFLIYYIQGEYIKAVETLQEIMTGYTATVKYVNIVFDVYNKSGIKGILHWLIELEQEKAVPNSYYIARWYALMEEKDSALTWLEKAFEDRMPEIPRINNSADLDILRNEPRFLVLIDKMGLTFYHTRKAE